ncbi:MAG: transcriptional regulator, partial [Firmicutes bacterium]|nr:transcriptional regulator [Bacillota bacterium]
MSYTDNSKQLREMVRLLERKFGLVQESEFSCCGITMAQCH